MGCAGSSPVYVPPDASGDAVVSGLRLTKRRRAVALGLNRRMDAGVVPGRNSKPLYRTHFSLLRGLHRTGHWDIYLHFTSWTGPVTTAVVRNLVAAFDRALQAWLADLYGREGFRAERIRVRVFGFVFHEGVEVPDSFLAGPYGKHPRVTGWRSDTEKSPWNVTHAGRAWTQANYGSPNIRLHDIRVTGNNTAETPSAVFHPNSWADYTHPEGCEGYQTKYWLGIGHRKAFAQRQYLRVQAVPDPKTGRFVSARDKHVLLHEMGHCFFLDDLYDKKKFPPGGICPDGTCLDGRDSVMHSNRTLTAVDRAMLRHVWLEQKKAKGL